jgi:hypothetical protein
MGMRPELRPASREACAVLAFGGSIGTRFAQTADASIPQKLRASSPQLLLGRIPIAYALPRMWAY